MTAADETAPRKRTRRKISRPVKILCLLWGLLVLFRVGYDLFIYRYGGTVAVRMTPSYNYLIHFPPGYTDFSEPRPLLVFLHGAGEVGLDVKRVGAVDPFRYAAGSVPRDDFPFIVLSPVVPEKNHSWNAEAVKTMIDDFLRHSGRIKIDASRIYLTGFSMGGYGVFAVAQEYPDFFAAAAPLAGGGSPNCGERYKSLPIRAYHGDADEVVPYRCSVEMIEAIRAAGNGGARLVTLPGAGHQICADVYGKPEIFRWFLEHQNEDRIHADTDKTR
ncbi:MAG: dienelactone hydrolase family protein [Thermoguttaceae bacterium]|nr:dienelactone hydrolase family protein [Thermoguttaceae bacterium]